MVSQMWRRAFFPASLALIRLRARAGRSLLVALGIAVGAALLAVADGGSAAVRDRAVQRALTELGPSQTSVQAVWSGVPAQSALPLASLDRHAKAALRPVTGETPFALMLFREARFGGAVVNLAAVDGLGRWLRVRKGRLPRPCRPQSCELVLVGGQGPLPRLPFLRVVGRATLTADAPFDAYFGSSRRKQPPLLLAEGVSGLASAPLPDADLIARTYGWILPVSPGTIHDWEIQGFAGRIDRANRRLQEESSLFSVSAPIDALGDIHTKARVAGERLLLVGGDIAVLLLAFAVLAATRLRRDSEAAWRRLTWFGARRGQLVTLSAVECGAIAAAAVVAGWAAGIGFAALLARHLGAPAGPVVAHSVAAPGALALAAALAAGAAIVVLVSLRARLIAFGGLSLSAADVAVVGALLAAALALSRGATDVGTLASGGGTNAFLLLLPSLIVFAGAVLAARIAAPALRLLERAGRDGPLSFRLAALSLARRTGPPLLAVVFLVISISVALFAATYRETLVRNDGERAAFAVPADFVLSEDLQRLVTIQQAASPRDYASLGRATPVIRLGGNVSGRAQESFTLLGLPARAMPGIDGWMSGFSNAPLVELAARLRPHGPIQPAGIELPPDARSIELPVLIRGDKVNLGLNVLNRRGDFTLIPLGEPVAGRHRLRAGVPAQARGGRVVAIHLELPLVEQFLAGHRESGTTLSVSATSRGVLDLARLRALTPHGIRLLGPFRDWFGTGGVTATGAHVRYVVNRAAASFFRPREPTDGQPVPVLASPGIAAAAGPGGILPLEVHEQPLLARVVGISRYFPSVFENVVVADRDLVSTVLNSEGPGSATPSEIWLTARPKAAAALEQRPFNLLAIASQSALAAKIRSDPLARGTLAILAVTALVALALALVGLLLTVLVDVRDESGELFDLEVQGASPADLRRHLRLRALIVIVAGIAGGVATGAALTGLVVSVVRVTAGATAPVPPLIVGVSWPLLLGGSAAFVVAAAAVVALATARVSERAASRRSSEGIA
ncbi:MAG: FtsX-like permease family protein [Actinobacteria bacterium]|nr:MAG: FtsX-like permease family protein [Actinomycetota bacterium]